MLINFSHIVKDFRETELVWTISKVKEAEEKVMATLGIIAIEALMAVVPDEQLTGVEKTQRYTLAAKIHTAGTNMVDVTHEERALIKDLIGKVFDQRVAGPAITTILTLEATNLVSSVDTK